MREKLLNRKEAAEYIGITQSTLASWDCTKRYKIPKIKLGRLIRYRQDDLDKWILKQRVDYEDVNPSA